MKEPLLFSGTFSVLHPFFDPFDSPRQVSNPPFPSFDLIGKRRLVLVHALLFKHGFQLLKFRFGLLFFLVQLFDLLNNLGLVEHEFLGCLLILNRLRRWPPGNENLIDGNLSLIHKGR